MIDSINSLIKSIKNGEVVKIECYNDILFAYNKHEEWVKFYIGRKDRVFEDIYNACKESNVILQFKNTFSIMNSLYKVLRVIISIIVIIYILSSIYMISNMSGFSDRMQAQGSQEPKFNIEKITENVEVFVDKNILYELENIIDYFKYPMKYRNIKMTKGVLLYGPPGTGKTLIAKYMAKMIDADFIVTSGSELNSKYVGEGAKNVKRLFDFARSKGKVVIFIDEIDSIARLRTFERSYDGDILNQLLIELDGFKNDSNIILIGATNRKDALDPAILRSGRFDRHIKISYPNYQTRCKILNYYLSLYPYVENNIDIESLGYYLSQSSPADIANIVRQASIIAAREEVYLSKDILTEAIDQISIGLKKDISNMPMDSYHNTIMHELGHAFMMAYHNYKIYKISAIPRGEALGWVSAYDIYDKVSKTKQEYINDIQVALAGTVMEELIGGVDKVTSGASSDLNKVKMISNSMIKSFGLGDSKNIFLDYNKENLSEKTKLDIDNQISNIIDENYKIVKSILKSNLSLLKSIKEVLIKKKEISGEEFKELIKNYI